MACPSGRTEAPRPRTFPNSIATTMLSRRDPFFFDTPYATSPWSANYPISNWDRARSGFGFPTSTSLLFDQVLFFSHSHTHSPHMSHPISPHMSHPILPICRTPFLPICRTPFFWLADRYHGEGSFAEGKPEEGGGGQFDPPVKLSSLRPRPLNARPKHQPPYPRSTRRERETAHGASRSDDSHK